MASRPCRRIRYDLMGKENGMINEGTLDSEVFGQITFGGNYLCRQVKVWNGYGGLRLLMSMESEVMQPEWIVTDLVTSTSS